MDRRDKLQDRQDELEQQTFNLFPERWAKVYRPEILGDIQADIEVGSLPENAEIAITDPDQLDAWFEQISQRRDEDLASGTHVGLGGVQMGTWI